jgi:hypothetical protein
MSVVTTPLPGRALRISLRKAPFYNSHLDYPQVEAILAAADPTSTRPPKTLTRCPAPTQSCLQSLQCTVLLSVGRLNAGLAQGC